MRDLITLALLVAPFALIAVAIMFLVITVGRETAH
jgi:hypothetical protein